jgi:hypothetical protein
MYGAEAGEFRITVKGNSFDAAPEQISHEQKAGVEGTSDNGGWPSGLGVVWV